MPYVYEGVAGHRPATQKELDMMLVNRYFKTQVGVDQILNLIARLVYGDHSEWFDVLITPLLQFPFLRLLPLQPLL